jgi:hypothetical protein
LGDVDSGRGHTAKLQIANFFVSVDLLRPVVHFVGERMPLLVQIDFQGGFEYLDPAQLRPYVFQLAYARVPFSRRHSTKKRN